MNSEEKLKSLKKELERLKSDKIRKEEQLNNLRQKRDDIISQITELGYTPENLSDAITKLKEEIDSQLDEIESKLSKGIVNER